MGVVENQLNKEEEENYIPILSPLLKNTCFPLKKNLSLIAKSLEKLSKIVVPFYSKANIYGSIRD